jgi:hypothetical protein
VPCSWDALAGLLRRMHSSEALERPEEQLAALKTLIDLLSKDTKGTRVLARAYVGPAVPWLEALLTRHNAHPDIAEKAWKILLVVVRASPNKVRAPLWSCGGLL